MTFEEAMETYVTREEAYREIVHAHHGTDEDWQEFLRDAGDRQMYSGERVLGWLGY